MMAIQSIYLKTLDPWTVQMELSDENQYMKVKAKVNQECLEDALDDLVESSALNDWIRDVVIAAAENAWDADKLKCTAATLDEFKKMIAKVME